jgi:hypothetical protein
VWGLEGGGGQGEILVVPARWYYQVIMPSQKSESRGALGLSGGQRGAEEGREGGRKEGCVPDRITRYSLLIRMAWQGEN